jgi:hypothetical protein
MVLTREMIDLAVWVVIALGLIAAVIRFTQDMRQPADTHKTDADFE